MKAPSEMTDEELFEKHKAAWGVVSKLRILSDEKADEIERAELGLAVLKGKQAESRLRWMDTVVAAKEDPYVVEYEKRERNRRFVR